MEGMRDRDMALEGDRVADGGGGDWKRSGRDSTHMFQHKRDLAS